MTEAELNVIIFLCINLKIDTGLKESYDEGDKNWSQKPESYDWLKNHSDWEGCKVCHFIKNWGKCYSQTITG